MPEGTRFSEKKLKISNEYSKKNNLPIFKNTLYPKMKGIWCLINSLKKENKMGNLIDFTHLVPNFKNNRAEISKIVSDNMGNSYTLINTYIVPKDNSINDYDNFKKWFLKIWKIKDNNLNTMNKENFIDYKQLPYNFLHFDRLIMYTSVIIFIYIICKTKGKIILWGNILLFLIIIIKNKIFYF